MDLHWRLILVGGCFLAGVGFLFSFLGDPLGRASVLDARENLALAEGMARGEWPSAPFYRAVLYPFLLSLPMRVQKRYGCPQTSGVPKLLPMATLTVLLSSGILLLLQWKKRPPV